MQLTTNTRAFIEAEQYSDFILMNLHDGLLGEQLYRQINDFQAGDTLHIKTVGAVTLQETEEDTPLVYSPIESGEITFQITEARGDAWYVTDWLREDGSQVEQLMVQRSMESTRAFQENFETDFLKTAGQIYTTASNGFDVNGFPHLIVSAETNNVFSLDFLINMRLAFDKANVPTEGRVFICDPVVEATLNKRVNITNDVTPFAADILQRGLSSGMRFFSQWYGWSLMTSNRLHVGDYNDGTTSVTGGVANLCMCVLDDQCKPIMGAWRRMPTVEGDRNKDLGRDEYVVRSRYGFGIQRMDTLGCIVTSATASE